MHFPNVQCCISNVTGCCIYVISSVWCMWWGFHPPSDVLVSCNHPSLIVSSPLISDQGCNYYYRNRNYLMSFVQRKYLDTPQSRTVELGKLLSYLLNLGSGEGKLLWSNRAAHGVVLLQLFNPTLHGGEGVIMTPYQLWSLTAPTGRSHGYQLWPFPRKCFKISTKLKLYKLWWIDQKQTVWSRVKVLFFPM